jgi:hypothetical protein
MHPSPAEQARQEAVGDRAFEVWTARKVLRPLMLIGGGVFAGAAGVSMFELSVLHQGLTFDSVVGLTGAGGPIGLKTLHTRLIHPRLEAAEEELQALQTAPVARAVTEAPDDLMPPDWVSQPDLQPYREAA